MGLDNPLHIAFLLIILLLVFGAKRLPEMGRSIGAGMREFKDSVSGHTPMLTHEHQQPPATPQPVVGQQPQAAQAVAPQAPVSAPAPVAPGAPAEAPVEPASQA
jgi:sec-independent protein translocase protein TatA